MKNKTKAWRKEPTRGQRVNRMMSRYKKMVELAPQPSELVQNLMTHAGYVTIKSQVEINNGEVNNETE